MRMSPFVHIGHLAQQHVEAADELHLDVRQLRSTPPILAATRECHLYFCNVKHGVSQPDVRAV